MDRRATTLAPPDRERRRSVDSDPQRHRVVTSRTTADLSRKKFQTLWKLLLTITCAPGLGSPIKCFVHTIQMASVTVRGCALFAVSLLNLMFVFISGADLVRFLSFRAIYHNITGETKFCQGKFDRLSLCRRYAMQDEFNFGGE